MTVHPCHHPRKRSDRICDQWALVFPDFRIELWPFLAPWPVVLFGYMHRRMRNRERNICKKRLLPVFSYEFQQLLLDQISRVCFPIQAHLLIVVPQVRWVKGVGLSLAVVAKKLIKV